MWSTTTKSPPTGEKEDPESSTPTLPLPTSSLVSDREHVAEARLRLEQLARERLRNIHLVVVSNRQPYEHHDASDLSDWSTPASGLTSALDPVMRLCGGTWVAHGSGPGDHSASDDHGRVQVPPDEPHYTLRRVWLTEDEVDGFYNGFSNQTLWPLCHNVYAKPRFESSDWQQYRCVNKRFADAVLAQIKGRPAIVLVQDYHLALVSQFIKEERPDVIISQFWHIPWPSAETMRICPWQREILKGLLGNDVLGFHVPHYCNNFLDSVDSSLEARIDWDERAVVRRGHRTRVRPYPISIDPETMDPSHAKDIPEVVELRAKGITFILGLDRMDYIKGIPEKILAFEKLLEEHPEHHGRVSLLQLATPTRSEVPAYQELGNEIDALAQRINQRFGTHLWQPVVLVHRMLEQPQIAALYAHCAACVVGSLQDGMNLVAKEFVAARKDLRGVLVLSRFAGALSEMPSALAIHPYDRDSYAATLNAALVMPADEQERRMRHLREIVHENTIYSWARRLLCEAIRIQRTVS